MEAEKQEYYRSRNIEIQKGIVTFKSCSTVTSEAYIWTYRTTSCDVVSIITTTVPIKNGYMKDIKLENREIKRLKPAMSKKSQKMSMSGSPFEFGLSVDQEAKKVKLNKLLLLEKKNFMAKLNISRYLRSKIENDSATKIQAIYRGHYTRINMNEITQCAQTNHKIRSNVRSYLVNKFNLKVSLAQYKNTRIKIRNKSATMIQCLFLRYLSRRCLRRRKHEKLLERRTNSAKAIQAMIRGIFARGRVKLMIERIRIILRIKAALKIQTALRGLLGKRKVIKRRIKLRIVAAKIIQNWYKSKYSRKMAASIKQFIHNQNVYKGALAMQGLVRKFIARRRVNRIRLRRLYKLVFQYVTRIQCTIRKFLSKIKVRRVKDVFVLKRMREREEKQKQYDIDFKKNFDLEFVTTKNNHDIYYQARQGNMEQVDKLMNHQIATCTIKYSAQHVEEVTGESLLTVAVSINNLDLVKKCIEEWRYNVNHRNIVKKQTALMIAVNLGYLEIVEYLLDYLKQQQPITPSAAAASTPSNQDNLLRASFEMSIKSDKKLTGDSDNNSSPPSLSMKSSSVSVSLPCTFISEADAGYLLTTAAANATNPNNIQILSTLLELNLPVNARDPVSGMNALLAACEVGNVEAFKLLIKYKADSDVEDEKTQQTCLHKACSSSLKIVQMILGLDPNFPLYMADNSRILHVQRQDMYGKDCILLATLAGHTDIVDQLENVVQTHHANESKSKKITGIDKSSSENAKFFERPSIPLSWIEQDMADAISLVESGNLICLGKLLDLGFDVNTVDQATGNTLALAACTAGDVDALDIICSYGSNFNVTNKDGSTPMHQAARYKGSNNIIQHLLTHQYAKKCNINEKLLLLKDNNGNNVFHILAQEGVEIHIDLLVHNILGEGLKMKNNEQLTPLLVACRYNQEKIIIQFIKLGADVLDVDGNDRNCLWHLLHPIPSIFEENSLHKRPYCSEFLSQSAHPTAVRTFQSMTRKEKDDELGVMNAGISLVSTLVKAGVSLYLEPAATAEDMLKIPYKPDIIPHASQTIELEAGDVLVQELSISLFKNLLNNGYMTQLDAWRLLMSSIRYDDGSIKVLVALLKAGIIDFLAQDPNSPTVISEPITPSNSIPAGAASRKSSFNFNIRGSLSASTDPNNPNSNKPLSPEYGIQIAAPPISVTGKYRSMSVPHMDIKATKGIQLVGVTATNAPDHAYQVSKLQELFFLDMTIAGWMIKLRNTKAFMLLIRKGFDVTCPIDDQGNACLHYIAMYGTVEMIDIVLSDKRVRLEQVNHAQQTAAMIAVKKGHFAIAKKLYEVRASPRKSLEGLYSSWALAFVRKYEKYEINQQTGRFGDDDIKYFNMTPDPFYVTWYSSS